MVLFKNDANEYIKRYVDFQLSHYDLFNDFFDDEAFFNSLLKLENGTEALEKYRSEVEANLEQVEEERANQFESNPESMEEIAKKFYGEIKILNLTLAALDNSEAE